jgi:DNA mismatch repair protein MutL
LDSPHAVLSAAGEMRWSSLRFVAQLRATYLLCEADEGLYILDQHAAAERVTFTKLSEQYRTHSVATQALLFPVTLEVAESDVALAEEYADTMAGMGVTVASRGARALSVHTVPKLLRNADPERLVRDLLNEVSRSSGRAFSDAIDLALATMACHGSARAGDTLAASEVTALLQALDLADFAGHCPHGRPIVTFLSYAELERKVQRR